MSFVLEYTLEKRNSNGVHSSQSKKTHTCSYKSAKLLIADLMEEKPKSRSTSPGGWSTTIYEKKKPIAITTPDGKVLTWAKFIREFS